MWGEEPNVTFSHEDIVVNPSDMWEVLKASVYNQNAQNDHIAKLLDMLSMKMEDDKKASSTCAAV